MDKLSVSSVWQIKHTNNCNICKDCALEFSDLESYVSLHKIIRLSGKYNFESSRIPVNSGLNFMIFLSVNKYVYLWRNW
jgi:hypothetical protein